MVSINQNVPTAVGTNRTYAQTIKENLQNGWYKIRTNPYVNMFFPIQDILEGNTLAAVTAIIPGKQMLATTAKLLSGADDAIRVTSKPISEMRLDEIIDAARIGNTEARQMLQTYGLDWGNSGIYRFAAKGEVDNILNGGKYAGRNPSFGVDVTGSPVPTTAANAEYRIKFKPIHDFWKRLTGNRARLKNPQLTDGWIQDGYTLDDVEEILRYTPSGYEVVYPIKQNGGAINYLNMFNENN
jgi:hypothetical protein